MNNDIRAYHKALSAVDRRDKVIDCYWKECNRRLYDFPPRSSKHPFGEPHDGISGMKQQARERGLAIFIAEHQQMLSIGRSRPCRRFHFDRQQSMIPFNNKINFLSGRCSPVHDFGTVSRTAPGNEIRQHEILQMTAARLFLPGEMHRQTGVSPIGFRRFDEPFGPIDGVRRNSYQLV